MVKLARMPMVWTDLTIALYLRISQDRQGERLGIERQDTETSELIESHGGIRARVLVYTDNDLSASSGKTRPDFERLMGDIAAGRVQVLTAWSVDRLLRRVGDALAIIEMRSETGLRAVVTYDGGVYDLMTASGRSAFIEAAGKAQYEAEHKGERHVSHHDQAARDGRRHGGGYRAFGYRRVFEGEGRYRRVVREEIDPAEAAVIRECAERVLANEDWSAIVRDLAQRGVVGVTGTPLTVIMLKRIMRSARISGRREHHKEITSDAMAYPAIIDVKTSDRLRQKIKDPDEPNGAPATPPTKKHLMTGIFLCCYCKHSMSGRPKVVRKVSHHVYSCQTNPAGTAGCGRLSVRMIPADDWIKGTILAAHDNREFWGELMRAETDEADDIVTQLADVESDIAALAADLGGRVIRYKDWSVANAGLERARGELLRKLDATERLASLVHFDRMQGSPSERWDRMNVSQRRALIKAAIVKIEVRPARRNGGRFDPWRLEDITWAV